MLLLLAAASFLRRPDDHVPRSAFIGGNSKDDDHEGNYSEADVWVSGDSEGSRYRGNDHRPARRER
jgi:hypothetical protein